jgi:hypothetical protein
MNLDYPESLSIVTPKIYGCKDRQKCFLLCESCLWCATCLDANIVVSKCPVCKEMAESGLCQFHMMKNTSLTMIQDGDLHSNSLLQVVKVI